MSIQQAETLREDEEFAFCRGRSNNDERPTILSVDPVSAHPVPGILERLEHKHALRVELGSAWAARPLTLVRRESIRSRSAPPDVSDRLMIPERLYGREREIDELRASFDRGAANGIPELVLAPLGLHDVGQLVVDALHCMPGRGGAPGASAAGETGGNPFLAIQLFTALAKEGLLALDPVAPAWQWDINRIRARGLHGQRGGSCREP